MATFDVRPNQLNDCSNMESDYARQLKDYSAEVLNISRNLIFETSAKENLIDKLKHISYSIENQASTMESMALSLSNIINAYNKAENNIMNINNNPYDVVNTRAMLASKSFIPKKGPFLLFGKISIKDFLEKYRIILSRDENGKIVFTRYETIEEYENAKKLKNLKKVTYKSNPKKQDSNTDYYVVPCFNQDIIRKQETTNFSNGGKSACNATVAYMLNKLAGNELPDGWEDSVDSKGNRIFRGDGFVNNWDALNIENVPGSEKQTVENQMKIIYEQVTNGTPVGAYCKISNIQANHMVVIVGVREGADPNNLQPSDFLVFDSNQGEICAFDYRNEFVDHTNDGTRSPIRRIKV